MTKKKVAESCFHNFQKHLVLAIRQIVVPKELDNGHEWESVGRKLWTIFAKSNTTTKKILHFIFG